MNLNELVGQDPDEAAGASAEFDPTLVSSNSPTDTDDLTLQDKIDKTVAEVMYGPHIDPETLPTIRSDLKDIEATTDRLHEYDEVLSDIQETNTVNQDTAVAIESRFGGFFSEKLHKAEFSQAPSRLHMDTIQRFITSRMALEHMTLSEKLPLLLSRAGDFLKNVTSGQTGTVAPMLAESIKDYCADHELILASLDTLKNTIVPIGDEFVDVTRAVFNRAKLDSITLTGTGIDQATYEGLIASYDTISELLKCHWTYGYLYAVIKGSDADSILMSPFGFIVSDGFELSIADLLTLYKDDRLIQAIEKTTGLLVQKNEEFTVSSAELAGMDKSGLDLAEVASKASSLLSSPIDFAAATMVVMKNIALIHAAMTGIVQFLEACQKNNLTQQ